MTAVESSGKSIPDTEFFLDAREEYERALRAEDTVTQLRAEVARQREVIMKAREYASDIGDERLWGILFVERRDLPGGER